MYKTFSILLIIVPLLIMPGCIDMPSDMIMPQWDVDLNLPIATKSYILDEIIKSKSSLITISPIDNLYMLKSEEYRQAVGVGELIKLKTGSSTEDNLVPLNSSTDIYLAFPEGAKLKKAVFQAGKIKIVGRNPSSVGPVTLTITVPGITKNSTVYTVQLTVPPNTASSPVVIERDLAGWNYEQPASTPFIFDGQLWFVVTSSAQVGAGIGSTFDITSSDFEFNSVTGYFPRRALSSRRNSFDLKIGDDAASYRDKLFLKEASLDLNGNYLSQSGIPFQIKVSNFKVMGIRKTGQQFQLHFNDFHDTTWSFNNTNSVSLQYNETNSNILQFIEFIPDSVAIMGDYILNPDNLVADRTVNSSDSVSFTAKFQSKSLLAIKQATLTQTDSVEFSNDDRDQLVDGKGASLTYEFENQLPLNVWIKVIVMNKNKQPLFAVTGTTGNGKDSLLINSAQVNNGITKNTITLTGDQITKLSQAYFTDVSVTVETSNYTNVNPPKYSIHANDMVKIKTYGSVKYRIKEKK